MTSTILMRIKLIFNYKHNNIMKLKYTLSIFSLLIFNINSYSQTQNCNNNAGGELTVNSTCVTSSMPSTNSTDYWDGAAGCNAGDRDDVWAWFTATSTSTTITYTPASNRDAILTLFDGIACSPTMPRIACSDNVGNGIPETIVWVTTVGNNYRIRVQRSGSNNNMTGDICVYNTVAGATCSDGIQNQGETGIDCGGPCPACAVGGHNIGTGNLTACSGTLYDAGGTGNYSSSESFTETYCSSAGNCISITFNSFSTESCCDHLNIYDGPNTSSTLIGTFDGTNSPGTVTSTTGCLTFEWTSDASIIAAGWEATISCVACPTCVDGILNGQEVGIDCGGPTCPACPCASLPVINDEACCATPVTVNPDANCGSVTAGTVNNATPSFNTSTCGGTEDDDVWFSFVATNTTHYVDLLNISGSTTDMYHSVYGGTCNSTGASLVCSDPNSSTVTGLTIGNTYYIRVYTWTSTGGQTSIFDVCVGSPPPPPANDEPCNAIPATVNTSSVCTALNPGWTVGATQTLAGCAGTANDDVWFSFVALAPQQDLEILNATGTTDMVHELFSGTCGSLTSLGCSDPNTSSYSGLTVGATYFVRVYTYSSTGSNTGFDLCITSPCGVGGAIPNCGLNYSHSTISYAPENYNQGTVITFADDRFADAYTSIGFDFCYDGVIYQDVLVSSNGYIIFPGCYSAHPFGTERGPSDYSPYTIDAAAPNTTNAPVNAIMGTWQDIYPSSSSVDGVIRTRTTGASPNGLFTVKFFDVRMYDCTSQDYSGQIMLFETTENIEIHLGEKTVCSTFNGGYAIMGITDYTGTTAVIPGGYNHPTQWTVPTGSPEGHRFTNNCAVCIPLPVELIEFKGRGYENKNVLSWKTASEINNDYFVLERSDGGSMFYEVATIPGGGNSNNLLDYSYSHENPNEVEYYRLRQVDYDGKWAYSKIISLRSKKRMDINIYPNPTKDNFFFSLSEEAEGTYTIVYTDIIGNTHKELINITRGTNSYQVNEFKQLSNGIYFIQIINENNTIIKTQKIVKQ